MDKTWGPRHSWALVVLLPILAWEVLVYFTGSYPSYECAAGYEASKHACDYIVLIFQPFRLAARWTAHHDKFFVAFGTIALVAFTGTLWWSTDKLWRQNERSIAVLERAYVFLGVREVQRYPNGMRMAWLMLSNAGRSPGIVGRVCAYFVDSVPTAAKPTFEAATEDNSVFLDFVIGSNADKIPINVFAPRTRFGHHEEPLFLVSYVEYTSMGRSTHVSYNCQRIEGNKALPVGPVAWNSWT